MGKRLTAKKTRKAKKAWHVEGVKAKRLVSGKAEYLIKWRNFDK